MRYTFVHLAKRALTDLPEPLLKFGSADYSRQQGYAYNIDKTA